MFEPLLRAIDEAARQFAEYSPFALFYFNENPPTTGHRKEIRLVVNVRTEAPGHTTGCRVGRFLDTSH